MAEVIIEVTVLQMSYDSGNGQQKTRTAVLAAGKKMGVTFKKMTRNRE